LYGGTGLGKTHLLHAAGNLIAKRNPEARVLYLHSEQFVSEMIQALRGDRIEAFKQHYRTAGALLIDDIQFFAGKDRTQEEFFHTFNALLDSQHQIILTCDRFPKEVGIEARLRSRFGWVRLPIGARLRDAGRHDEQGPGDNTTRRGRSLPDRPASAERATSSALNPSAPMHASAPADTESFAQEVLRDPLVHDRRLPLNIKKPWPNYKMRVTDLLSPRRIAPSPVLGNGAQQELTEHSLPEIGDAFGGRDHTTVLHACRN
jgi:chromosomal replication initiator protein